MKFLKVMSIINIISMISVILYIVLFVFSGFWHSENITLDFSEFYSILWILYLVLIFVIGVLGLKQKITVSIILCYVALVLDAIIMSISRTFDPSYVLPLIYIAAAYRAKHLMAMNK